jgi:hypothetical protein
MAAEIQEGVAGPRAWGWVVQSRLKLALAVAAVVIAGGATALVWSLHRDIAHSGLWKSSASSVLQYAIPPVLALFGWIAQRIIVSRPTQSTPKQLRKARKALIGRGLEWWRGIPPPAWPGRILRAGLSPLEITWSGTAADGHEVSGSTSDVKALVRRFRDAKPFRLVISGPSGSGKSIFARLLMAELLRTIKAEQPVPVFLPVWCWDPDTEPLNDWIKRRISEDYPELGGPSFGSTAVTNLVDRGMILPVLDGLDSLPRQLRDTILTDGRLAAQDRIILTCRTKDYNQYKSFVVLSPENVQQTDAISFLGAVTRYTDADWHSREHKAGLTKILSDSRLILMTSAICAKNEDSFKDFADLVSSADATSVEARLLKMLVPVLISEHGERSGDYPAYDGARAEEWLTVLAPLGLWDSVDLGEPQPPEPADEKGKDDLRYPGVSCIAWWNLHRGVPFIREHQAVLRAVAGGLATLLVTFAIFQCHYTYYYSWLTAGTYGLAVFFSCLLLGRDPAPPKAPRRLARMWTWPHPFVKLVAGTCVGGGLLLWWRLNGAEHYESWVAFRTGFIDGFNDGLLLVVLYLIAKVPRPPRGQWTVSAGPPRRSQPVTFVVALALGIPFGLEWDLSDVLKGMPHGPLEQMALTGLITGVDFVMGAWLFEWSSQWSRSARTANPRTAIRADLLSALLRPLILGFTFAFSLGISPPFNFTGEYVWVWFAVGLVLGSLENEWPLYLAALLALRRRPSTRLPLRLTRFLQCCSDRGLLRPAGQAYQIQDKGLLDRLYRLNGPSPGQAAPPTERHARAGMISSR